MIIGKPRSTVLPEDRSGSNPQNFLLDTAPMLLLWDRQPLGSSVAAPLAFASWCRSARCVGPPDESNSLFFLGPICVGVGIARRYTMIRGMQGLKGIGTGCFLRGSPYFFLNKNGHKKHPPRRSWFLILVVGIFPIWPKS